MRNKKQIFLIFFLLPLFVFMFSEKEHSSSNLLQFIGKSINFILLFGILAYFLSKPLRSYLEKRSSEIRHSLSEAEKSRKEADKKLAEVKAQLDGLEERMDKMIKEAEIEGRKEKERILSEAKKEAEKMKRLTRQEIEMLLESGIQELIQYTVEIAAVLAQERIKKRLTDKDHSLLIDKSIERLSILDEEPKTH
jgi:F-type H+-transporting ATPase subunit b